MKLASAETIKKRLAEKNLKYSGFSRSSLKVRARAPKRLKHNGGDGGDYARTYMSDYAVSY